MQETRPGASLRDGEECSLISNGIKRPRSSMSRSTSAPAAVRQREFARRGDRIVMTAGVPWEVSGSTNLIKVEVV